MNIKRTAFGGILSRGSTSKFMSNNMPLFYFLFFIGMIYITTAHYSEKRMRNIQALKEDLKVLRWEYMTIKSDLMYNSTYSQVAKTVSGMEMEFSGKLPKKILVKQP